MKLSEIETEHHLKEDYTILLPRGDNLLLYAPVEYGGSAARFNHPNIIAIQRRILEYKHYRSNGSKFWTSKAGIYFYFLIPKSKIELTEVEGSYSYIHINIGGEDFTLSISGWTNGKMWTDIVGQGSSLCVIKSKRKLRILADNAIIEPIDLNIREMDENEGQRYTALCAYHDAKKKLDIGDRILLDGCSYNGCKGPFTISDRRKNKQHFLCSTGETYHTLKVLYQHINWTETAKLNGVDLISA